MKFDLSYLESLNGIICSNDFFKKKTKEIAKTKKEPGFKYQFYNQLCTCIVRIRETTRYLEKFSFRKSNDCGQAFDFYEFINCVSIIKGCTEVLFSIFDKKLVDYYPKDDAFKISNPSKKGDLKFFNFIRSAASMHPAETTKHKEITKHVFEVYPYAMWIDKNVSMLLIRKPKESDIQLLSWSIKTKCKYKYYYLVSSEFDQFVKNVLESISGLVPIANSISKDYKEKICLKRLKSPSDFKNKSEYYLYLRKRINSRLSSDNYLDSDLLLASHLHSNKLIGSKFKNYIANRIKTIAKKTTTDISSLKHCEIFDELYLGSILSTSEANYVSEKFHDYLQREALIEIQNNKFVKFTEETFAKNDSLDYSDAEWSVRKLIDCNDNRINEAIKKANSYCDLYELILEIIYKERTNAK